MWLAGCMKNNGQPLLHMEPSMPGLQKNRELRDWMHRLRSQAHSSDVALLTAGALGEISRARSVGVFLSDEAGENLILHASWDVGKGSRTHKDRSIPPDPAHEHDPLWYAFRSGRTFLSSLAPSPPASVSLFHIHDESTGALCAYPLFSQENKITGTVIFVLPAGHTELRNEVYVLCDFCALCIGNLRRLEKLTAKAKKVPPLRKTSPPSSAFGCDFDIGALLVGESPAIQQVREQALFVAPLQLPVLLTGESGTGKKRAASAIHQASPRHTYPFAIIDCSALSARALESELFGHIRGAFPGAHSEYAGALRAADNGTIVLDEIDKIPAETQARLNNMLATKEIRPMGGTRVFQVNPRIVATTSRDLKAYSADGIFRQDLFEKLSALTIAIPPLRVRVEDIPSIVRHMLQEAGTTAEITPAALQMLIQHQYMGNISELASLVTRAVNIASNRGINTLSPNLFFNSLPADEHIPKSKFPEIVRSFELSLIQTELAKCGYNLAKAAASLGIPSSTLRSKIKSLTNE